VDARWRPEAFLGGPLGGIFKTYGVGVLATRAEGARKVVSGRRTPSRVQNIHLAVSGSRPAGSQRVLRRCSEGASFVGSPANGSTRYPFPAGAAKRLSCAAATAPTAIRVELEVSVQFPEFGGFALNDERLRPVIGRGGLVVVLKRDQVLTACAARGLSLEELRLAAGISRPTLQAALRGKRVRPRTALKLARALNRHPVLEEIGLLLEAS